MTIVVAALVTGAPTSEPGPAAAATTPIGTRWYFAEGTTLPGWTEFLTVLNPLTTTASVTVRWSREDAFGNPAGNPTTAVTLQPGERRTLDVAREAGFGFTGVAAVVESSSPVVAERPLYLTAGLPGLGLVAGAHVAAGVSEPRTSWLFAEGTTLPGFREYLAVLNPGEAPARVTLTYLVEGQPAPVARSLSVPAHGRRTVDVVASGEGGLGQIVSGVAVRVDSSVPVVAERPIYVARSFGGRGFVTGATIGAPAAGPETRWTFAEGTLLDSFAEFLTIANPTTGTVGVAIDYRLDTGTTTTRECSIPATSRLTVVVFDPTSACGLGRDLSNGTPGEGAAATVRVVSGGAVVAERAMYYSTPGTTRQLIGAHDALGAPGDLPWEHLFAEGTSRPGFHPYWTLDNADSTPMAVTITYLLDPSGPSLGGSHRVERHVVVPATSRLTIKADETGLGGLGPGFDFGARIASDDRRGFGVERPIYVEAPGFSDGDVGGGVSFSGPATLPSLTPTVTPTVTPTTTTTTQPAS